MKKYTEKHYQIVQTLIDADIKPSDIRRITGWSNSTIYHTKNSDNYKSYLEMNKQRLVEPKKKKDDDKIDRIIELLGRISNTQNKHLDMFDKWLND